MAIKMLIHRENINPGNPGNPQYRELDAAERKYLDGSTTTGTWHGDDVVEFTYTGRVLRLGEHNHYHDSDFYAVVWDDAKGGPREVEYASTRGWSYFNNAAVDADEETLAKFKAWEHDRAVERQAARDAAEAATPREGKTVKVTKGRKIPKGTVAVVVWFGEDKYNSTQWLTKYRVGLMIDGQRVFTSADNVEVVAA
jgi:hypothetical protein